MNWSNLGLATKILLPTLLTAALMVVLSLVQINSLTHVANNYSDVNSEYLPGIDLILNADRDLYQAKLAERSLALGMRGTSLLTDHSENMQQVHDRISKISTLKVSDQIKRQADQFLREFDEWRNADARLVEALVRGEMSAAEARDITLGANNDRFESIRERLDTLGESMTLESQQRHDAAEASKNATLTTIYLLLAAAIALVIVFSIFFPKAIIGPIRSMSAALQTLASGRGDLNARMDAQSNDELGTMAHQFNAFMDNLKTMISNIRRESEGFQQNTSLLSSNADVSERVSREYSSAMEMVATSNEQMGLAIREVSENTQQVSSETKASDEKAKQVSRDFSLAMDELQSLVNRVNESSKVIQALEAETTNIESVLGVIKGIAEQTNLLALNAAIEAARAGEQGRGFAVVADEVRTLASRTQQSTGDINEMIERLRSGVGRAVGSMKDSQEKAEQTVEHASRSQENINTISSSLVNISDRIIQIASAIEEQTSVIGHINENLTSAKLLSEQGNDNAHATSAAVHDMKHRAERLNEQVAGFRL